MHATFHPKSGIIPLTLRLRLLIFGVEEGENQTDLHIGIESACNRVPR